MNPQTTSRILQQVSLRAFRANAAAARLLQQPRLLSIASPPTSFLRRQVPATCTLHPLRQYSTDSPERPLTDRENATNEDQKLTAEQIAARKAQEPGYEMTFTCRKCLTRSTHRVTKQAYHFGTTLITCPGCKNRHLISDHLKIFSDKGVTIEDILREKGEFLKKGRLGDDGAVEFYEDDAVEKVKQ